MPYVVVQQPFATGDYKVQRQFTHREIARLEHGADAIRAGQATEIAVADEGLVKVCSCGRAFAGEDHPHFSGNGHKIVGGMEKIDDSKLGEKLKVQVVDLPYPTEEHPLVDLRRFNLQQLQVIARDLNARIEQLKKLGAQAAPAP